VRVFRVGGGLVDVRDNTVKLMVSTAEKPSPA
jgi:hypothetical protein